ncbi:MAG: hypothetical protein HYY49_03535 [Ignavibacteriales bacterium]|nr:hypothetical protein [Ignavibacteriales bacterium]
MKLKRFYIIGAVAILLVSGGVWYFGFGTEEKQERKVLYWTDPMIPGYKSPAPGKSPMGMEMIPVYEDSALGSEAEAEPAESHKGHEHEGEIDYYTCTMHPSVKEKQPGRCPICSMDLVPVMRKPKSI